MNNMAQGCMACGSPYGGVCEYCTPMQVPMQIPMQMHMPMQQQAQYPGALVPIECVWHLEQQVQQLQQLVCEKDHVIFDLQSRLASEMMGSDTNRGIPRETILCSSKTWKHSQTPPPSPVSHLLESFSEPVSDVRKLTVSHR